MKLILLAKLIRSIPIGLFGILIAILSVPAIAYVSFHYIYPIDPDAVYAKYGDLRIEWKKFFESDNFTEYLGESKYFGSDSLMVDILVLRTYQSPQTSIHDHDKLKYSSVVMHQSVNCRSRVVSVRDIMMFSKSYGKGMLIKDLYELDWDLGEASPGSIDEKKVAALCDFES